MDKLGLYSIGEFAKLCGITVKTLHHYDKIGLLKPEYVDQGTLYRYYSPWQMNSIFLIRKLQELGLSLQHLQAFFSEDQTILGLDKLGGAIQNRELELMEEIKKLQRNLSVLQEFKYLSSIMNEPQPESDVNIRHLPKRYVLYKRHEGKWDSQAIQILYKQLTVKSKASGFFIDFGFMMGIVDDLEGQGHGMRKLGLAVKKGTGDDPGGLPREFIHELPEGLYAIYIFKGSYEELRTTGYARLQAWLEEKNYEAAGSFIEIYFINQNMTEFEDDYVTQIEIPIKPAG